MLYAGTTSAKDVILDYKQNAPFRGVLVPENTYKEYTLNTEMLQYAYEQLHQCTEPEPDFWDTWGKPILFMGFGALAVQILK